MMVMVEVWCEGSPVTQSSSSTPASSLLWWCGGHRLDTGEWWVSDIHRRHVWWCGVASSAPHALICILERVENLQLHTSGTNLKMFVAYCSHPRYRVLLFECPYWGQTYRIHRVFRHILVAGLIFISYYFGSIWTVFHWVFKIMLLLGEEYSHFNGYLEYCEGRSPHNVEVCARPGSWTN